MAHGPHVLSKLFPGSTRSSGGNETLLKILHRPFSSWVSAHLWLMTMSAMGLIPAALSSRHKVFSSSLVPYFVSRSYRRWGRYPSGETECDGGGSQTASTPVCTSAGMFARTSPYQLRSSVRPSSLALQLRQ